MPAVELWAVVRRVRAVLSRPAAALTPRALTPPVLTPRALTPPVLTPRALTPPALTPPALTPPAQAAPSATGSGTGPDVSGQGLTAQEAAEAGSQATPGGRPVLTAYRLARARAAVAALSPDETGRLRILLGGVSPVLRAYLLAALAAGHVLARVEQLAADLQPYAHDDRWVHRHLGLLDGGIGPATYADDAGAVLPLRQLAPVTCGPSSLIVLRVLVDPVYALALTTGGDPRDSAQSSVRAVGERFRAEQGSVHHAATRGALGPLPWPKALGTPPWGAARFLNRLSGVTGVDYVWQTVDNTDAEQLRDRLAAITAGLELGVPVPLYVGRHVDRHVVLAFGRAGDRLLVYEPSRAEVVGVREDDVVANRLGVAGWDRLEGVLRPCPLSS